MPPVYMNKPEFALKRAEEFLDVGKKSRALEALTEAIKNRKHRIWQKSHEDIMRKFIHLCVELKQSQTAKEGLHQYKNLTANVNPKSLEDIVRYYLKLSETKCDEAREKANVQATATTVNVVDVDDLDLAESPEGMLLKVVSTDTSQDRADRVVLLPWVRFNWEAYRHCLDLLRNLSKLESLYHDIASQAFKFCLKYGRKTELRKLCEMLRNHIGQISKREVITPNAINLNNPETQELNLRTRLVQLDHAIAMEMWQEAFRAIEDVHGLMSMLKKVPKAALKANYFEKLALVFLRAGNAVFHAAAQQQLFILYRGFRKEQNPEEIRRLAVSVLFATLAVPLQPPRTQLETLLEYDDTAASKMKQLTLLVGYTQPPTRTKLVEDLQKHGILQYVRPELQALYQHLEVSFDPLHMGPVIADILTLVNNTDELVSVRHYINVIEQVAVGKHLRQLSQVYDSVEIDRVIQMMPYTNWHTIERVAIETARNTDLEVRIDHRRPGLFKFGSEVSLAPYETPTGGTTESSESQIPADRVRSQLVMLLTGLTRVSREVKEQQEQVDEKELRKHLFDLYRKNAMRDLLSNLTRPQKSDSRQKSLEDREREREQQAKAAKKNKDKESAAAEAQRMQRDTKQFEEQRNKLREKELEKQVIKEKIEKMKQTEFGMRVLKELEDWENVDVKELDRLEQRHREEMRREEEENNQRLKVQEKKIDHIVRAKQLEEVELRRQDNEAMIQNFYDIWSRDEERRIQMLRDDREFLLKKREKMKDMKEDYHKFLEQLQQRKQQSYTEKKTAWDQLYEEQRMKRLNDRRKKREEDRRETFERQQKEEAEQREMEEARIKLEEETARKRAEDEARQRKLDEQARKQQEREREIEERNSEREQQERNAHVNKPQLTQRAPDREERREPAQAPPPPGPGKYVPPSQRGGGVAAAASVPSAPVTQPREPMVITLNRPTGENAPAGPGAGRNLDSLRGEGPRGDRVGDQGNGNRPFDGPRDRDFGQRGMDGGPGGRFDRPRDDRPPRDDRRGDMNRGPDIKRQGAAEAVPERWR